MAIIFRRLFLLAPAVLLVSCAGGPRLDPARSAAMADSVTRAVLAAIANPARSPADQVRDKSRQSAAVLRFFRIGPGMTVLDLYSGGGYYTELLSYVVGPNGRVVSHNNSPYQQFARDDLAGRFTPGRLPNVERLLAENNQISLPAARFDAVLMTNVYHDIYFVDDKAGWPRIDGPRLLAEVFQSLKPGGVLGVVDHAALPGAPQETGGTLHRIDPALLKRDLAAAGFILDAESDVLVNPGDDRTKSAFDPSVRGRTDQVVLRFRKRR